MKWIIYLGIITLMSLSVLAIDTENAWNCVDEMYNDNWSCGYSYITNIDFNQAEIEYYIEEECETNYNCTQEPTSFAEVYEFCIWWDVCQNVTKQRTIYPYNTTTSYWDESKVKDVYSTALGNLNVGIDIIENGDETPILKANTILAENYVTNTTKATDTMEKVLDFRLSLSGLNFNEMQGIILDSQGKLSDNILLYYEKSNYGSYKLGALSHTNRAVNVLLMWENLRQQSEIDELKEDMCSLGVTKYC